MVADESFPESVWFINVNDSFQSAVQMIDDYKNVIAPGLRYIEGRFMKKVDALAKGLSCKLSKKKTLLRNR